MISIQVAAAVLAAFFCIAASIYDLRERRIPNLLNLTAFLLASLSVALAGGVSIPFALFAAACFAFAYLLYKLGVWAGGDAKFFTALMAFLPAIKPLQFELILAVFLISAVLTLPVLAVVHFKKMLSLKGEFFAVAKNSVRPSLAGAAASTAIYLAYSLIFSPALAFDAARSFAISFAIVFFISFLTRSFGIVSCNVLRQAVAIGKLVEGDIPAQSVYLKGGRISYWMPPSPGQLLSIALRSGAPALAKAFPPKGEMVSCLRARGLSKAEIVKLKGAGVKQFVVKQSIPFAPALALGFWLVAWL